MILYTLAPLSESVFSPPDQPSVPVAPKLLTCAISGGFVQGLKTSEGIRVTRVISTDPKTYLSKEFDLGAEVSALPFLKQQELPGRGDVSPPLAFHTFA